ncbi:hypothetical protein JCM10049v2_005823 [Rhodotorula toruloides]
MGDSASPTPGKGKSRASDPFERSNDLESAPLLSSPSSSGGKRKQRLRHGRGPLVREDSDADEPLPSNDSDEEEEQRVRLVSVHPAEHARARWTLSSIACLIFGLVFCLALLALAVLHIWVGRLVSEQARHGTAEEMAQRGMVWAGPSAVRVQASQGGEGLVVEVDGMAGIDVRKALDWEEKDEGGWVRRMEGRIARWGVKKAKSVTVEVGEVAIYDASGGEQSASSDPLVLVNSLDSLRLPLSYPTLSNPLPTMQPFTLHIPLSFPSPQHLADFAKAVYASKDYRVRAEIREVVAQVGEGKGRGPAGWVMRRIKKTKVTDLARVVEGKVPDLPTDTDPAEMVNLTSYGVYETTSPAHPNETVIALSASAIFQNPLADAVRHGRLPVVAWGVPFRLPISVHLPLPPLPQQKPGAPTEIALAKISSLPFFFPAESDSAKLDISGHLVPAGNLTPPATRPPTPPPEDGAFSSLNSNDQPPLSRALSRFVARYLSGRPNDIYIRYDLTPEPPLPGDPAPDAPFPPRFVADMVKDQTFHVEVPGTNETPDFFKNLRMEDMKIRLGGGDDSNADLLATGKVVGEVVLPDAAKKLAKGIDAKVIWPDVLVYDGELPPHPYSVDEEDVLVVEELAASTADQLPLFASSASSSDDSDSTAYPPSPVPRNAFARMRPAQPMQAKTIHIPGNSTHNATTLVEAAFVDAPLYLLPGRGDVLRRFVGKIIFGGNHVKASMAGITSVRIGLSGFGEVELVEIPIEASFMVGRGGIENPPSLARLVGLD